MLDLEPTGDVSINYDQPQDINNLVGPSLIRRSDWEAPRQVILEALYNKSGSEIVTLRFSRGGYDGVMAQVRVNYDSGVSIPDGNLRARLEAALGKRAREPIFRSELAGLGGILRLNGRSIRDLTGLEYATGVTALHLNQNQITDLALLSGLTSLVTLVLHSNRITDIGPLSSLTSLRSLDLRNNRIADIGPLVANTGLGSGNAVHLGGNANTMTSVVWDRQIPALQARGVTVNFDLNPLPSVTVSPTSLTIDTSQLHTRFGSYMIVLDERPTGRVFATVTSDNSVVEPLTSGLIFFRSNYDRPQTIEVRVPINNTGRGTITYSFSGGGYNRVTVQIPVQFGPAASIPDANLRAGLNAALGKPAGDVILRSELAGLTTLSIRNRSITNLTGLEHATSLTDLDIAGNGSLTNLNPLSGLTSLNRINLNGTGVSNLTPLSGLTNLRQLFLRKDGANITGNTISDVSALMGLTNLFTLELQHNEVANIAPLAGNMGLGTGDTISLQGNPLNFAAYDTYIPALENRGARVSRNLDPRQRNTVSGYNTTPTISEAGGSHTYRARLVNNGSSSGIVSADRSAVTVSPTQIEFGSLGSTVNVTVTGVDDDIPNGTRQVNLTFRFGAGSTEVVRTHSLNVTDDDNTIMIAGAPVAINSSIFPTTENFRMRLDSRPTGPVSVNPNHSTGTYSSAWDALHEFLLFAGNLNISGSTHIDITFSGGGYDGVTASVPVRVGNSQHPRRGPVRQAGRGTRQAERTGDLS